MRQPLKIQTGIITFTNQTLLTGGEPPPQAFLGCYLTESSEMLSLRSLTMICPNVKSDSGNAHKWMTVRSQSISVLYAILAAPPTRPSYLALAFLECVVFSDELGIGAERRPRLGRWVEPKYSRHHEKDQDSEGYEKAFHGDSRI
jgi:hypothetical protein